MAEVSENLFLLTGRWYHLKRLIFLCMFKLRQRKRRKEHTLQEMNAGYGASVTDPDKMEDNPPLLDNPFVSPFACKPCYHKEIKP